MIEDIQGHAIHGGGCPQSPPPLTSVYTRTLHRACEVVGGVVPLALKLRVPRRALERWLEGESEPPMEVFLACVDLALTKPARKRN